MGKTIIEWTQMTWNPIRGCSRVSEGCLNCYAARQAARGLPGLCFPVPEVSAFDTPGVPAARMTASGPRWTGRVELIESMLDIPLRRKKPTTWFVNSMSDLFHESLPDETIDRVFAVMALCPQHTFQVLTKRAARMLTWATRTRGNHCVEALDIGTGCVRSGSWIDPIENVWLGVSCENQQTADERIPLLLQTPAAVRFLSLEPMLGPINVKNYVGCEHRRKYLGPGGDIVCPMCNHASPFWDLLDWVILGGESGPGARPMHPDWAQGVRDQCVAAGVPFFFKQWGEWAPADEQQQVHQHMVTVYPDGHTAAFERESTGELKVDRVGKKVAGHLLDGQEWRQMPEVKR